MKRAAGWIWLCLLALVAAFILWPEKHYTPYQVSPEYQAQVDAFHIPPMPDGWTWQYFETVDGAKLRYGSGSETPDAKATLLYIPGFTGILDMYGEHLSYWQNAGYNVIGLDLRGQGGSSRAFESHPEKSWVSDFGIYAQDLAAFSDAVLADQPRPVIIVGVSFGGHTAFRAMAEYSPDIDGLILLAPVFRPNTAPYSYGVAKTLIGVMNALGKSKRYGIGQHDWRPDTDDMTQPIPCSSAPKRVYVRDAIYTNRPELRMGTATNGWLAGLMASGEAMQEADSIARVTVPVNMLLASEDQIIINDPSEAVCTALEACQLTWLDGAGHCIPQEADAFIKVMYGAVEDMTARLTQ